MLGALSAALAGPAWAQGACQVVAEGPMRPVVELYTSEGCNSCPPADRWLSAAGARGTVLAAAFHVDYWDRLGWRDRFASAEASARQRDELASVGARFAYTPQVIVNGRDSRAGAPLPAPVASPVHLLLHRDGDAVRVEVSASRSAGMEVPPRLALWWALREDDHVSQVRAGENAGVTLTHDAVAREFGRAAAWTSSEPHALMLHAPSRGEGGRVAKLLVVVTDAATGRPLQAAELGC